MGCLRFTLYPLLTCYFQLLVSLTRGSDREPAGQNLIVFLIDGYGASLYNRTDAKLQHGTGMQTLVENGVKAESLRPVFPTQSYPNWYSLSTGLYTENHNFTSDFMYNEESDTLFQRDMGANDTEQTWWTGTPAPFWYDVGKAQIDVHCYWFTTCHRIHVDMVVQVPPERRHSFKEQTEPNFLKHLPKAMKYIRRYQSYRQQLLLVRYDGVGKALRIHGEGSDQALQALSKADAHVRKIQCGVVEEEIEANNLIETTNLIVLSDHGLLKVEPEDQFFIEECLADYSRIKRVVNSLSFALIYPERGHEDTVFFELKVCDQWAPVGNYDDDGDEVPLVSVYRREEIPQEWNWKGSRFMAPIVVVTRPGVILLTRQLPSTEVSERMGRESKMLSGWSNDHPEMQGIFMARGPAFKLDYKTGPLEVVDVYQLVLNILGIPPSHEHNGTWANVEEMLTAGWENRGAESNGLRPQFTLFTSSLSVVLLLLYFMSA